jgi:hypothetical protein
MHALNDSPGGSSGGCAAGLYATPCRGTDPPVIPYAPEQVDQGRS